MKDTKRDMKLDILRGIAATMVVVGHVMQLYDNFNQNILFNIIFSIQMPLFMMISGCALIFSKPLVSFIGLWNHLKKKCFTLLLPWFVWSLLAYIFLSNKELFSHIK